MQQRTSAAGTVLQPGDRLYVWPDPYDLQLGILCLDGAWSGALPADDPLEIAFPEGVLTACFDPESACLQAEDLGRMFPAAGEILYALEVVRASPLSLRIVPAPHSRPTESSASPVAFDSEGAFDLLGAARRGRFAAIETYRIGLAACQLSLSAGFERLLCLPLLRDVVPMEHQARAALTALRRFRARALLCDEVGLGKTIEAGIVLSELTLRRIARRILVLTPPSLVAQWDAELRRKFGLDFVTHDAPAFHSAGADAWRRFDRIIASFHTAKRDPHRSAILDQEYDIVVIDEAHHLRNRNTMLWKFAGSIRKRFMLLLTATPVQNRLEDIFNLITVLKPGYLHTASTFRKEFVARDGVVPRNLDRLQGVLAEVMVRNRRSQVKVRFTRRLARSIEVPLDPPEVSLYRDLSEAIRTSFREGGRLGRVHLRALQAEAGSSPAAVRAGLESLERRSDLTPLERDRFAGLASRAASLGAGAKAAAMLGVLRDTPDKMVVFTRFRATLNLLAHSLERAGIPFALFHGGLSRRDRTAAIREFQGPARILLSSDAGSEGQNLQFCHAVLNFDLPWNPMVLEQRVGRLSRIGQEHDVQVINLVASGTIEAHVLRLLDVKIRMFELVVGEIDMVLGNLDSEKDFENRVMDLWVGSDEERAFVEGLDRLGEDLLRAKEEYLKARAYDDALFGDRFVPEG